MHLSDLDESTDGKFGIEWEFEDGGRLWEWFLTESDRRIALEKWEASEPSPVKEDPDEEYERQILDYEMQVEFVRPY